MRSTNAGSRAIAARRLAGGAMFLCAAPIFVGCYAFVPTTTAALPEATPVTVKLSDIGTVSMRSALGAGVNEVEGAIVRSNADTIVVTVDKMYATGRQAFSSSGTTTSIPRAYVEEVQVRTFSKRRTVWTVIGAVALAVGAAASVGLAAGGTGPGGGTVQP
jgi:hypothetical protein